MWLPRWVFEKFAAAYETASADTKGTVDLYVDRMLAAKAAETQVVLTAKASEINLLKETIADLKAAVSHERSRSEAIIDRLLASQKVPPIQPELAAQLSPARAEMLTESRWKEATKLFAGVGEDEDDEDPLVKTEVAGQRVG